MSQQFMDSEGYHQQSQSAAPPLKGRVAAYRSSKVGYFWSSARRRTTGRFLMTGPAIEMESDKQLVEKAVDYSGLNAGRVYIFVGEDCTATVGRRYSEY